VAGFFIELSTENPECFQERSFMAKLRSSNPLSTKYFITRLLNTSVILAVYFIGRLWKGPVLSIPPFQNNTVKVWIPSHQIAQHWYDTTAPVFNSVCTVSE
jgi:hypothetical protein